MGCHTAHRAEPPCQSTRSQSRANPSKRDFQKVLQTHGIWNWIVHVMQRCCSTSILFSSGETKKKVNSPESEQEQGQGRGQAQAQARRGREVGLWGGTYTTMWIRFLPCRFHPTKDARPYSAACVGGGYSCPRRIMLTVLHVGHELRAVLRRDLQQTLVSAST